MGLLDRYSDLTGEGVKKEKKEGVFSKVKNVVKEKAQAVKSPYNELTQEASAIREQKEKEVRKSEQVVVPRKPAPSYSHDKDKKFSVNPLSKLLLMVKKDFKLIIRTKTSALVVLIGPLLIIFLVGMAFNTSSLYNIKVGTYSESYSDLTNQISDNLKEQQYTVIKTNNRESCIESVKLGDIHVCAIFPPDMSIVNARENTIDVYVDESRLNLAHLVSNVLKGAVLSKSQEISESLAGIIINTLESAKNEINTKESDLGRATSLNREATDKLGNIETDLTSISSSGGASFNFSKFDDEVTKIQANSNISKLRFKGLEDLIDDLEIRFIDINSKTQTATNSLSDARSSLESSQGQLDSIKSSFTNIKSSIESIQITDVGTIASPIKTKVTPVTDNESFLSFLFPTLVVLVLMFMGILLSSTLVMREKESKSYFRNFITPTSELLFMIGTFFTNILLILFQLIILFLVALYFFPSEFVNTLAIAGLLLLIASAVFVLLGMFIGYIFKSEETGTLGAIAAAFIMLLFSNTILPIETLPETFANITSFNPFVITESALKKVVLFGSGLPAIQETLYILLAFAAVFFILSFAAKEVTKRRLA